MGLDITVYSNLKYVGHHEVDEQDKGDHMYDPETWEVFHVEAYAYKEFPHALMGVPNLRQSDGYTGFMTGGCYEVTSQTETHAFVAGSYSGYNAWRRDLAEHFNPYRDGGERPPSPEGPFYELIWFADNEGTIAELAAANLLAAFREHRGRYYALHPDDSNHGNGAWYRSKYDDWTRACELAAARGLVDFH